MEIKKEKVLNIFLVIINLIVVIKLLKDSFKITDFGYLFMALLVVGGILLYLFFSEILKGKKRKFIFLGVVILVFAIAVYKTSGEFIISEINIVYENILRINEAALAKKEIGFEAFKHIFAIIIPLIVSISTWITRKWSKFPILFSSSVYIGFWYLIFYGNVTANMIYFVAVFVASFGISEYVKRCREYAGRELKINISSKTVVVTIISLTIALPLIVRVLPQDFKGKTIDGIITSFRNQFAEPELTENDYINNAVKDRFTMRQSGYSNSNTSLGGPISINKRKVFTVKADKPYYLKARVKDNYSGSTWTASNEKIVQQMENNYKYEGGISYLFEALSSYEGYTDIKAVENSVVITPERNFKSSSCFTPNGAMKIEEVEERIYYNDIPTFMSTKYIRDPYIVKFISYGDYDNYLGGIENEEYMKYSNFEDYSLPLRHYGQTDLDYYDYLDSLVDTTNADELQKYNKFKWTYINYMQVPETVSEEVYNLVVNILSEEASSRGTTIESLSSHDKALAIRNYLKENYKYTTNVKRVNEEADFVTNFLMKEREGYCTYFASANAIMCRIAGVPTRYSEGFKMQENKNPDGEYVVTNEEAHAWTEILVNPYRDLWAVSDAVATPNEEVISQEEQEPEEVDTPEAEKDNIPKPEKVIEDDKKEHETLKTVLKIAYILAVMIIGVIVAVMSLIGCFYIRRKRVTQSRSIIPIYIYSLRRLKTIGIEKMDNEGDLEFTNRIRDEELRKRMKELAQEVYKEFYGGVNSNNIDKAKYIDYVEAYVKGVNKGYKYLVKKYFSFK